MKILTGKQTKTLIGGGLGIFVLMACITATVAQINSPVLGSNAADSATSRVSVGVNSMISLALDTNSLQISVVPTETGAFSSDKITATVSTNSAAGYELYFSSEDNSTNMAHSDSTVTSTIASDFEGTVTSSTMAKNKWGYSLDNTDFSKIPVLSENAKIKDLDHYPSSAERNTDVFIGTKIASDLTSGRYSKNVKFSVLAHAVPLELTMQTFDKSMLPNVGDSIVLKDERDGRYYKVEKMRDGNVWMMSNLILGGDEPMTLHPSDTDVSEDFVLPASNLEIPWSDMDVKYVYVDEEISGYYSWNAATAGEGVQNIEINANVEHSICPKGWRLPTGGVNGEQAAIYPLYNNDQRLVISEFELIHAGVANGGNIVRNKGESGTGKYWSSTSASSYWAFNLGYYGYDALDFTSYGNQNEGFSIRCIAR